MREGTSGGRSEESCGKKRIRERRNDDEEMKEGGRKQRRGGDENSISEGQGVTSLRNTLHLRLTGQVS